MKRSPPAHSIRTGLLVLMILVTACSPAGELLPPPSAPVPAPRSAALAGDLVQRVDSIFARWDSRETPGCVVAADLGGQRVLSRAYGMADLEHSVENRPESILEAGSVAKQLTAGAVVLLSLDGRISLDDDVRRYVPELPDYGATITIRHLLNHTSGLRDWGSVAAISGWSRSERTHDQAHVLDIIGRQSRLNYPPGAAYSYTNSGYNLLAILVERVSGSSFAEFSRQRIFEPLEMRSTQWRDDYRRLVPGRTSAYDVRNGQFVIDRPIEQVHGNGGLLTTVDDLLRWDRALASGELGGARFVELMHERGVLNDGRAISYASGVQIGSRRGAPQVSHTGATSGYRAFLGRYPDQGLAVALLCNVGAANPGELGGAVVDLFLSDLAPTWSPPAAAAGIALPREVVEARAGLYRDALTGAPLRLVLDADVLRIEGGARLVPISPSVMRADNGDQHLEFAAAGEGPPRIRITVREADDQPHEIATYIPVEAFAPDEMSLAEFQGSYHSDDAETSLQVVRENGRLVLLRRPDARFPLQPVYGDVFQSQLGLVRFHRRADGMISELGLSQSRVHDIRFQRRGG